MLTTLLETPPRKYRVHNSLVAETRGTKINFFVRRKREVLSCASISEEQRQQVLQQDTTSPKRTRALKELIRGQVLVDSTSLIGSLLQQKRVFCGEDTAIYRDIGFLGRKYRIHHGNVLLRRVWRGLGDEDP